MTRRFVITATGTAIEQYIVIAKDEQEARARFEQGLETRPVVSEVQDSEIQDVTEIPMLDRGAP